ncbi:hypothetical protein GIB67_039862 [Kingdonia uniflora]|uniref:Band 7 domain-containing protein n=1 Tax=Kingdonia uniflora TaxID=39325 RepID=A0A7J7P3A7_9MAGN|nr:hypothetical protein GIB67_039862 [Kingdonia uniflora]
MAFVAIAAMILVPTSFSSANSSFSIILQVPEGHVGVYWRGGETITEPGFHLTMPLITQFEPIQVTLQTDQVEDLPCGTKGGVMISFEKIEVVNRLLKEFVYETLLNYGVQYDKTWIYDKIHHDIIQFCSAQSLRQVYIDMFDQIDEKMKDALQVDCTCYAPGIEILSVRVTKPTIPASIKRNFKQMEEERTKDLIAMERQMVAEKEAETQKKISLAEAEKNLQSLADADFYKVMKEDEANKLKLTPEYLDLRFIESIANNSEIFFGNKVPNMVYDQSDNIMCVGLVLFFSERPQHVIPITVGGMKNDAWELQVLSPLVPIREVNFLRFCKKHSEGV